MHELIYTRHNHQIDLSLSIWGWEIPVYLFLGGLVAGIMIIAGYFILTGRTEKRKCSCFMTPMISLIALSLGMLSLFMDLEHKLYVWRMYATFQWWSPMSWGSWILLLVYPVIIANALMKLPEKLTSRFPILLKISDYLNNNRMLVKLIGGSSLVLGVFLGLYTGILLSAFGARPLWNSSMLWILFLTSGLSSAAALIHLIAKEKDEREMLAKADNRFLFAEILIVFLFLVGLLSSTEVHITAAKSIISGDYAPFFWVFVMGMGIILPLIIQLLAVNHKIQHTPVAPIMVIIGGLFLRFVIVYAGQYSHWTTGVFHLP